MAQNSLEVLYEAVVTGGAVTTLSTGTISLVAGTVYSFECGIKNVGISSVLLLINADTTNSNYARTVVNSDNTVQYNANPLHVWIGGSGYMNELNGTLVLQDSTPAYFTSAVNERSASIFGQIHGGYNTVETTFTELQLTGATNGLGNGTYIRIWEPIQTGAIIVPATTTIADVTVSGGTVSSMTTGAFTSLVEGDIYMFRATYINDGTAGNAQMYFNADTTTTNYEQGFVSATSSVQRGDTNANNYLGAEAAGVCIQQGMIGLFNGVPYVLGKESQANTGSRGRIFASYSTTESDFTELQLDKSTDIGNDSTIQIWKLNQTPLVDVTVSGGAVTTLDTGTFTALTEGKTYMMVTGIKADTSSSFALMQINGDTTAANYTRGTLPSGATPADSTSPTVQGSISSSGMSICQSYLGVHNGTPFINSLMVCEFTSNVVQFQAQYNTSETNITSVQLVADTASWLLDGSFIKIWEIG